MMSIRDLKNFESITSGVDTHIRLQCVLTVMGLLAGTQRGKDHARG